MAFRAVFAIVICLCASVLASAQVVRFETTMGDFDMVLNPTNNAKLQAHVDNMLEYVERESYKGVWINRAAQDFVLQMGGFYSMTSRAIGSVDNVRSVRSLAPVPGEPASENPGLSNTVGTVSLALSGGANGTNQDSGTTSFFVNVGNNTGLDADFTVFAAIPDMSVINAIMALTNLDRTQDPAFGADPGNLAFIDVPIQADGKQVFIKRAFLVSDAMAIAQARAQVRSVMEQSLATFDASALAPPTSMPAVALDGGAGLTSINVPEPTAAVLLAIAASGLMTACRRRR